MSTPQDLIAALEYEHPHIALRVKMLWGLPECGDYIRKLLLPRRPDHKGFSEPVARSLMSLQELHGKLFPQASDVWGSV